MSKLIEAKAQSYPCKPQAFPGMILIPFENPIVWSSTKTANALILPLIF